MRVHALLALAALAASAAVAGGAGAAGTAGQTAVTITYWPDGSKTGEKDVWTLRCHPAAGTVARPAVACRRLEGGGRKLVAPVPASSICTQIYGGPQVARIIGQIEGRRVFARFTRENGCHIARWNRLAPWLLPRGGVTQ